jgi:hypothetical protein
MEALAERLGDAVTGAVLEGVQPPGSSALKPVTPRREPLLGRKGE